MPKVTQQIKRTSAPTAPAGSFLSSLIEVSKLPTKGIKLLITGPTGSGKTTLAATAPKPALLIRPEAVEDGEASVKTTPGLFTPSQKMTRDEQLVEIVEYQRANRAWKTVILDGVQFYQDLVLKRVLGLKEVPAQLSWGIANQDTWGIITNEFKERMRAFLSLADEELQTNVIITGGERLHNDKEGSLIPATIGVALTPSAAGWLNHCCEFIVCTQVRPKMERVKIQVGNSTEEIEQRGEGMEFVARCTMNEVYTARLKVPKDRKVPEFIVDPTWDKIYSIIKGEGRASAKS